MNLILLSLARRLLTELAAYKPTEGKAPAGAKTNSSCVTYELFYRPEQAQFSRNARVIACNPTKYLSCFYDKGRERCEIIIRRSHVYLLL